jgi:hypothetical protein
MLQYFCDQHFSNQYFLLLPILFQKCSNIFKKCWFRQLFFVNILQNVPIFFRNVGSFFRLLPAFFRNVTTFLKNVGFVNILQKLQNFLRKVGLVKCLQKCCNIFRNVEKTYGGRCSRTRRRVGQPRWRAGRLRRGTKRHAAGHSGRRSGAGPRWHAGRPQQGQGGRGGALRGSGARRWKKMM